MKIALDISQIVYKGTGVARFTSGLLDAILDSPDKKNHFTFFFSSLRRKIDPAIVGRIKKRKYSILHWRVPPTALSLLWNDMHHFTGFLPSAMRKKNAFDYFITSDWTEPALPYKKATIVHDLVFKRYPQTVEPQIRSVQEKRLRWISRESHVIFADSISTAQDLAAYYRVPQSKIVVNYPGVECPEIKKIDKTIPLKYRINAPYILSVGKLEPRKNLERLIEAFVSAPSMKKYNLAIVGPDGWGEMRMVNDPRIRFTGFVEDRDLYQLYSQASVFVYPTMWEGFGYPAIEAMGQGTPVSMSNTSSLAELGSGGAAYFFNPFKPEEIKKSLKEITSNDKLRAALIRAGLKRSKQFTWDAYYKKMIQTLMVHNK